MFIVAVKETNRWYLCEDEMEVAKLIKQLLADFSQDRIIVAEQWQLTVLEGDVTIVEPEDDAADDDDHDWQV
ncbi:MAG: hypothetical protein ACYC2T_06725 [Bacillota bacterium]